LNGGDIWWDLSEGQYIVPAVDPALGVPGVSSLFAGAVWLGGFDDAMNLKWRHKRIGLLQQMTSGLVHCQQ
jgi:hypothetical protein